MLRAYLDLTKPRISFLFALTGMAAMMLEGRFLHQPVPLWAITIAIFMIGGAANALNQYFERDIDSLMHRTAKKRPLPQKKMAPQSAVIFAAVMTLGGCLLLGYFGTWLAVVIALATIGFYSFYYTLWLKPRTPYNIVIGGAAGATGPLIGWACATGNIPTAPFILFLLIFLWTPPHFWALALCCKEDYKKANYPMFPLVYGDEATRRQIVAYSFTLLPCSIALIYFSQLSLLYTISATILGVIFIGVAVYLFLKPAIKIYWTLFAYSIFYLLALFVIIMIDRLLIA